MGELKVFRRKGVWVAERDGGGGIGGGAGRTHGVLSRRESEQGDDNRRRVGGNYFLPRAVHEDVNALRYPVDQISQTRN